jgi:hypothetical protein
MVRKGLIKLLCLLSLVLTTGLGWAQCAEDNPQVARLMVVGGGVPVATGDSCTDGLLFSWHCEDLDVTVGTPKGCSAGDTTGSAASGAVIAAGGTDGSNYLNIPTAGDYVDFTISSRDIADDRYGTLTFDLYIDTFSNGEAYGWIRDSATGDMIRFSMLNATNYQVCVRYSKAAAPASDITICTSNADLQEDTWYSVTVKWTTADVNPNLYIVVDGHGTAGSSNTNLNTFTNGPDTLRFGDVYGSNPGPVKFDNIKIYNSYLP